MYITVIMNLDWVTLYDYMSLLSRSRFSVKINNFYESFYPLKYKKTGSKAFELKPIEREGFLGIVATYISKVLFLLELFLEVK